MTYIINNTEYTKREESGWISEPVGCYWRALAIAAARCSAVGFSAVQLTYKPSAVIASCVVGPMAANWKQGSLVSCQVLLKIC